MNLKDALRFPSAFQARAVRSSRGAQTELAVIVCCLGILFLKTSDYCSLKLISAPLSPSFYLFIYFFCQRMIEPTLTIHKKRHCRARCWVLVQLLCNVRRILLAHAKLLVLSAANMRLSARLEAERWELEGGWRLPASARWKKRWRGEERRDSEGAEGWVWMNRRDMADLAVEQLNLIGGCTYYSSSLVINTSTSVHLLAQGCDLWT